MTDNAVSRTYFTFPDGSTGPGDWDRATGRIVPAGSIQAAADHLLRVRLEEELRAERALATWYEEHPTIHWDDLQAEHRARLVLLERLSRG